VQDFKAGRARKHVLLAYEGVAPDLMSRFLHVVVGCGIPRYFRNAVESVVEKTSDDVLAIYNYLGPEDWSAGEASLKSIESDRVFSLFLDNQVQSATKTGSLYEAYNRAVEWAIEDYDYVNFLQADMQLMHWSAESVAEITSVFERANSGLKPTVVCISTSFDCKGKWTPEYYNENIAVDSELQAMVYQGVPMVDVGVFSLRAMRDLDLSFGGSEVDMQKNLKGIKMPRLTVPTSAFVPWPATVRDGQVESWNVVKRYPDGPLLVLRDGYPATDGRTNNWMEDWIFPNGWVTFAPYWPTDVASSKWFARRLAGLKNVGGRFFSTIDSQGNLSTSPFAATRAVPSAQHLLFSLGLAEIRSLVGFLARGLRYRYRLVSAKAKKWASRRDKLPLTDDSRRS